MTSPAKRTPVMMFQVERSTFTAEIVAYFCHVDDKGTLLNFNATDRWDGPGYELAEYTVRAWLGHEGSAIDYPVLWGPSHRYSNVHSVELANAEAMVKHLRKMSKGLDKLEQTEGYPAGYFQLAMRVARIVGAKEFYVRDDKNAMTLGNAFRKTDATGVQVWLTAREDEVSKTTK